MCGISDKRVANSVEAVAMLRTANGLPATALKIASAKAGGEDLNAIMHFARHHGADGRYLLRIEDTDAARSTEQAAAQLLEDLRWLGLHWDNEQLVFQSKRTAIYDAIIDDLMARDLAFRAYESREELDAMRKVAEQEMLSWRLAEDMHPLGFQLMVVANFPRTWTARAARAGSSMVRQSASTPRYIRNSTSTEVRRPSQTQ